MRSLILIVNDVRSTHNVGSLLRTAEGFGVDHVYITGYTAYPQTPSDNRLPHIAQKLTRQINKTALGATKYLKISAYDNPGMVISQLKTDGYRIVGLEQDCRAIALPQYNAPKKVALIIGREVEGLESNLKERCDDIIEIPMYGKKESFNVVQATAIALYALRES